MMRSFSRSANSLSLGDLCTLTALQRWTHSLANLLWKCCFGHCMGFLTLWRNWTFPLIRVHCIPILGIEVIWTSCTTAHPLPTFCSTFIPRFVLDNAWLIRCLL